MASTVLPTVFYTGMQSSGTVPVISLTYFENNRVNLFKGIYNWVKMFELHDLRIDESTLYVLAIAIQM